MESEAAAGGNRILVSCPHCGAIFMLEKSVIGKRCPCYECEQTIDVIDDVIIRDEAEGLATDGAAAPAAMTYSPGQLVQTNHHGQSWEPARVSEVAGQRLLLTTFNGRQFYKDADHIRPLEVVPGTRVLSLDQQRGVYVPGTAHAMLKDAVFVSDVNGRLQWRPREVVYPDTIGTGTRVVRRDVNKRMVEVGRVCERSRLGYRVRYDDGMMLPWGDSPRGRDVGITAGALPSSALREPRGPWDDRRCVRAAVFLVAIPLVLFPLLMALMPTETERLVGAALFFAVYAAIFRVIVRWMSPLFRWKIPLIGGIVCLSVLVLSIAMRPTIAEIPKVLLYVGLAAGAVWAGRPKSPKQVASDQVEDDADLDVMPDRRRDYGRGERVMWLPAGEAFFRIAIIESFGKKRIEVKVPGGESHVLTLRDVFTYEISVPQRVVALREELNIYLPAVITEISDDELTVRFDDGESDTVPLFGVRFPCRKEVLKMGPAACQAMHDFVTKALVEARALCDGGDAPAAHNVLAEAQKKYPFDPTLHLGHAIAFEKEGNFAAAAAEAYQAVRRVSGNPRPYAILGNAYLKMGRLVEAEEAFRAALNVAPDQPGNWQNVGKVLLEQGEEARAGHYFAAANEREKYAK
ncbi:MAG: tetratricopeptide repeat protein [Planctomycetota bacterium]|jgi:hypothetical protein